MKKLKRISALVGVILIFSMYLLTLISALISPIYTNNLFIASVYSTFVIPVLIYAFMLIYKVVHKNDAAKQDVANNQNTSAPKK